MSRLDEKKIELRGSSGIEGCAGFPDGPHWSHSLLFIVLTALLLRLAVITIGHTYRITPRRDHFQFGWEMGRLARSIATGQGFSSPTDLPSGPSAWAPPLYPAILAADFKLRAATRQQLSMRSSVTTSNNAAGQQGRLCQATSPPLIQLFAWTIKSF